MNLPVKNKDEVLTVSLSPQELQAKQTEALQTLSTAVQTIANFLSTGGLTAILQGYARSQAVKEILGGLAAHDGRNALDARVLKQNAVEIVEQVEKVFDKYSERLNAKEERDPEIKDSETDYLKWKDARS